MAEDITNIEKYNAELLKQKDLRLQLKTLSAQEGVLTKDQIKQYIELEAALSDLSETLSEYRAAQASLNKAGEKFASDLGRSIGLSRDFNDTMMGSLQAVMQNEEAMNRFGKQLTKTFHPLNIANTLLQQVVLSTGQLMTAQDDALVSFNKATGASAMYGDELTNLEDRMSHHGITMDIANETMTSMVQNIRGLNKMTKLQRKDIADTTALLDKFGVAADTTTANIEFMTRSLGMSVTQSTKFQREIFSLAKSISMPTAEMAEQFKSAGPKLAAFGKLAGATFKKLAIAAKKSGMEIEQLLTITEQFDTFEGAAESVGKLNAILGGPFLNSMEMVMETDPTERMKKLSQGLRDAGKSFDQMSYYERKAIASAAGLADANELALVMAGNFEGMAGSANLSSSEIQKLAEESKDYNTMMDELNQTMREFAISMKPVIEMIKDTLNWIQSLSDGTKKFIFGFAAVVMSIGFFGTLLSPIFTLISKLRMGFGAFGDVAAKAGTQIEEGSEAAANGITNVAEAAGKGKTGILVLSVALIAMGVSIAIAAYGVSFLVAEFAKMSPGKILASAVAIFAFGAAMAMVVAAMSLIATSGVGTAGVIAIIAIGAVFALAAFGVAAMVGSFTELFKVMSVSAIGGLLVSMYAMSIAFTGLLFALPGLLILGPALALISLAMANLSTSKIDSMTSLFEKMNELTAETASNIFKIGTGMGLMSVAMLNPLMAMVMTPVLAAGTAAAATTGAGDAASESRQIASSVKSGGAPTVPVEVNVKIEIDPLFERFFKAKVLKVTSDELNGNKGSTAS